MTLQYKSTISGSIPPLYKVARRTIVLTIGMTSYVVICDLIPFAGLGLKYNSDHVALVNAYVGWKQASYLSEPDKADAEKRTQAARGADEFLKKHSLSKEIMGGADQNMRSFMNLMAGSHGYNGNDSKDIFAIFFSRKFPHVQAHHNMLILILIVILMDPTQ